MSAESYRETEFEGLTDAEYVLAARLEEGILHLRLTTDVLFTNVAATIAIDGDKFDPQRLPEAYPRKAYVFQDDLSLGEASKIRQLLQKVLEPAGITLRAL